MKRKTISVMLALGMALSLAAGCGSQGGEPEAVSGSVDTESASVQSGSSRRTLENRNGDRNGEQGGATGPNGETATSASEIQLTEEEKQQIRDGGYTAAISLHYGEMTGPPHSWRGCRLPLRIWGSRSWLLPTRISPQSSRYPISRPSWRKTRISSSAFPRDATATADAFQTVTEQGSSLSSRTMCRKGMTAGEDYVSCVSADNYGNGCIAAELMGEALGGEGQIAMVYYDTVYFVTNQRDQDSRIPSLRNIPASRSFPSRALPMRTDARAGRRDPDPVSHDRRHLRQLDIPMEGVLSSVRAAGLTGDDVKLTTIDLGNNMAKEIAEGSVVGTGSAAAL